MSGSASGEAVSVVPGGWRCSPELISALKPRPRFLDWLRTALPHRVSASTASKMFHGPSKAPPLILNSLTLIMLMTQFAH